MKKITFLSFICALFMGQAVMAQQAQEITYVEDPSQGYLFNKFKDNWFVTGEGGVGFYMSPGDTGRDWYNRLSPAASIYVGKWFSPEIGVRFGVNWLQCKGLSTVAEGTGIEWEKPVISDDNQEYYRQKFSEIGPVFDVMFNLTNIVCGYKPNRWYNLSFYVGGGGYWSMSKKYDMNNENSQGLFEKDGWEFNNDRIITFRGGIINSFNISKQVQLALDIRYSGVDNHKDEPGEGWNKTSHDVQAYLGVTYLFKKREWNAPIVPVCPEPENCDALRARLQAADARIADLEQQLKACLERPEPEVKKAPLATIYYPKNVYKLTKKDVNVLTAVAEVMKDNPNNGYVITGWADNYTGNDEINTRLRHNRVNGVKKQLTKLGVPDEQVEAKVNHANLVDLGEKYQALGRAVTIEEK